MALFDPPSLTYPTRWKEFSLDYKLLFAYGISMVVLCVYGDAFSVKQEILATIFVVTILLSLSIRYRRRMNWRWPGVQANGVLNAAVTLLLASTYEYAAIPLAPLSDPRNLPLHLVALGILGFASLRALKLVQPSKTGFLRECEAIGAADSRARLVPEMVPAVPTDPFWKRAVRNAYGVVFQLIWLDTAAFLYAMGVALRNGSSKPTSTQRELLSISGKYVLHSQKVLIDLVQTVALIGVPSVLVIGLILHFFLGVRLFPNMTTLQGRGKQPQKN
jgi:hypothetical protein